MRRKTITQRVIDNARANGVTIVGRGKWGNKSPVYQLRRKTHAHGLLPSHAVDTLWQHISVTHIVPIGAAMRTLHKIGMDRFGSGVSYNWVVHPITGEIGLGQSLDAKGTHTINWKRTPNFSFDQNLVSIAICVLGMPGVEMTQKAKRAVSTLIGAHIAEGALRGGFDYVPHSLVAAKECPTQNIRDDMPEIRREIPHLKRLG